jgi:hypothetical protein
VVSLALDHSTNVSLAGSTSNAVVPATGKSAIQSTALFPDPLLVQAGASSSSQTATQSPPPASSTTPVPLSNGLLAQYYEGLDLTNLRQVRTDATVNFNWGQGSPIASLPPDNFSIRWSGQVRPRFSETYTFYTNSDDGVRLWVNGQLLVDRWVNQAPTEHASNITLAAGQLYDIRLEYYDIGGGALSQLLWSSPSQAKEIVPQTVLFSTEQIVSLFVH